MICLCHSWSQEILTYLREGTGRSAKAWSEHKGSQWGCWTSPDPCDPGKQAKGKKPPILLSSRKGLAAKNHPPPHDLDTTLIATRFAYHKARHKPAKFPFLPHKKLNCFCLLIKRNEILVSQISVRVRTLSFLQVSEPWLPSARASIRLFLRTGGLRVKRSLDLPLDHTTDSPYFPTPSSFWPAGFSLYKKSSFCWKLEMLIELMVEPSPTSQQTLLLLQ